MNKSNMTLISFAVSILFWWFLLGSVELAVGFLVGIFVHEMGHYIACKHKGLDVLPPVFTPFGASVSHSPAQSADVEAFVAFAGPLFGGAAGLVMLVLGLILNVPMLFTIASYTFLINLLNLIPMKPLDGGGISMAIHRNMWILGIPLLLWLVMMGGNNMFNMMIIMFVVMGFFQDLEYRKMLPESYFEVSFGTRIGYGLAYLGLAGALFWLFTQPQVFLHMLISLGL